ncbi:MAG: 8-oxoguanine glycosylase ogg1 [Paramarteilia canceri]
MKQYLISDEILKENYSQDLKGLVLLSQDVVENLFSFICSANNNIKRISLMVEFLANSYGKHIGTYCGKEFHSFPTLLDLKLPNLTEQLEINNFGYRGKRIAEAVEFLLSKGGEAYLKKLKSKSYNDTHKELCEIPGIGAKVADCISLMSMNHFMAVPIDTHMYQVAKAQYKLEPQAKTLTPKNYRKIRSFYQNLWGKYAGIVQLVVLILFAKILSLCLRKLSSLSMVDFFQFFE